jgi:glycosyltransferase involved in cell wall biosynthesis
MKVLHVVKEFSAPSETFVYDLVGRLGREPSDTHAVLASRRAGRRERPFSPVFRLPLYETCLIDANSRPFKRLAIHAIRTANAALLRLLLGYLKPDVIHCHFGWSGVAIFRLLNRNLGAVRLLVSLHGTDVTYLPVQNAGYLRDLRQIATEPGVLFTVNSRYLARRAEDIGVPPQKIELLYNSLGDGFARTARPRFAPGDPLSIINVARFVSWKGHRYLLEGFARFHAKYQPSSLTLVGDGETRGAMQNLAGELGIGHAVRFTGAVPHAQIPAMLASANVYVQPSIVDDVTGQVETFGVSVLEAIACGLPVVVTGTGGLPEVVGDGPRKGRSFFIVREKSASDIADVLTHLADRPHEFEDNATYTAERLAAFSPQTQLRRLRELYERLR